jgi:hypothetical protein
MARYLVNVAGLATDSEVTVQLAALATKNELGEIRMIGSPYTAVSGANSSAVITVAAPGAGKAIQLNQITFSYSGNPTNGLLTISANGATIHSDSITTGGVGPVITGYKLPENTELSITLAAGGNGIVGRVNASISVV